MEKSLDPRKIFIMFKMFESGHHTHMKYVQKAEGLCVDGCGYGMVKHLKTISYSCSKQWKVDQKSIITKEWEDRDNNSLRPC